MNIAPACGSRFIDPSRHAMHSLQSDVYARLVELTREASAIYRPAAISLLVTSMAEADVAGTINGAGFARRSTVERSSETFVAKDPALFARYANHDRKAALPGATRSLLPHQKKHR